MGPINKVRVAAFVGAKVDKALETALEEPVKRLRSHFCDACIEKKKSSDINKELSSDNFLREYLIKSYNEVSKVKNLLYQDNYQLVEETCIFTNLTYEDIKNNERTIKTDKIQNILDISHKTIITGLGGMGKTIMMKFLHINCIKQLTRVPVFITLRNIQETNGKVSIFDSIKETLTQYGTKMSDKLIEASLEKGCYLILFDGFDEVKSKLSDTIANEIMKFSRKYDNNYYVVSSRPSEEFISWSDFKVLHTEPLSLEQALTLIDKLAFADETKKNFKNELEVNFYHKHKEFASNPLLLTTMFLVYYCNGFIPEDFCDFYEEAFRVMFYRHDKTKFNNYKREIHSKLSESELQSLFEHFCFKTFFRQKYSFKEHELLKYIKDSIQKTNVNAEPLAVLKDLSQNLCMLIKDGLEYKFVHRSFQEYFAAMYTKLLPDAEQKKLLSYFIEKHSNIVESSEYFPILIKLDGERFYKNIISDILDEIEELYNSVGQDDYEFLLKLLSNYEFNKFYKINIKLSFTIWPHYIGISTLYLLYFFLCSYDCKNDDLLLHLSLLNGGSITFCEKYDDQISEIIDIKEIMCKKAENIEFKSINAADLTKELCINTIRKNDILNIYTPDLNLIKSCFQNRLYQESSIDDLLEDM